MSRGRRPNLLEQAKASARAKTAYNTLLSITPPLSGDIITRFLEASANLTLRLAVPLFHQHIQHWQGISRQRAIFILQYRVAQKIQEKVQRGHSDEDDLWTSVSDITDETIDPRSLSGQFMQQVCDHFNGIQRKHGNTDHVASTCEDRAVIAERLRSDTAIVNIHKTLQDDSGRQITALIEEVPQLSSHDLILIYNIINQPSRSNPQYLTGMTYILQLAASAIIQRLDEGDDRRLHTDLLTPILEEDITPRAFNPDFLHEALGIFPGIRRYQSIGGRLVAYDDTPEERLSPDEQRQHDQQQLSAALASLSDELSPPPHIETPTQLWQTLSSYQQYSDRLNRDSTNPRNYIAAQRRKLVTDTIQLLQDNAHLLNWNDCLLLVNELQRKHPSEKRPGIYSFICLEQSSLLRSLWGRGTTAEYRSCIDVVHERAIELFEDDHPGHDDILWSRNTQASEFLTNLSDAGISHLQGSLTKMMPIINCTYHRLCGSSGKSTQYIAMQAQIHRFTSRQDARSLP